MRGDDLFDMVKRIELPRVHSRSSFIAYLKFLHSTMCVTVPLFEDAAAHSTGLLREYYKEKANEERDHDNWMADDIKALDAQPTEVDHAVAAICGAQYYYLRHVAPHAFLGYCVAMECDPMPMSAVEHLEQAFGDRGCRTLRYHAKHDVDHAARLREVIADRIDDLVIANALITRRSFQYHARERMYLGG